MRRICCCCAVNLVFRIYSRKSVTSPNPRCGRCMGGSMRLNRIFCDRSMRFDGYRRRLKGCGRRMQLCEQQCRIFLRPGRHRRCHRPVFVHARLPLSAQSLAKDFLSGRVLQSVRRSHLARASYHKVLPSTAESLGLRLGMVAVHPRDLPSRLLRLALPGIVKVLEFCFKRSSDG
jgi:hypothetical protein